MLSNRPRKPESEEDFMTLNGCEVEKVCEGDHERIRDAAVGYLVKLGYRLKGGRRSGRT